ncbi:hypothetical protein ACFSOZ_06835 [Mesorhizobium newzealandense]|uniref:DUF982 domain-containing protein n=1 Tax=Mesorhizobium newzealandense TaxID=1300302 RepID=A0ABW4U767_9HYPH
MLRIPQSQILNPEDLETCQCVFDQIWAEAGADYVDGEILASTVLAIFLSGATEDDAELLAAVRARRKDFIKLPS